jgi:hypothetical protein
MIELKKIQIPENSDRVLVIPLYIQNTIGLGLDPEFKLSSFDNFYIELRMYKTNELVQKFSLNAKNGYTTFVGVSYDEDTDLFTTDSDGDHALITLFAEKNKGKVGQTYWALRPSEEDSKFDDNYFDPKNCFKEIELIKCSAV